MKQFFYGDLKETDLSDKVIITLKNAGITDYIVDFDIVSETIIPKVQSHGIKCYYRVKLYSNDMINFDYNSFENELIKAKRLGFFGFAMDLEAYNGSTIWQVDTNTLATLGVNLREMIGRYFSTVAIYPENLWGDKYENYGVFFDTLTTSTLNFYLLTERNYEEWLPWKLAYYQDRAVRNQEKANVEIILGVWYESMSYWHFMKDSIEKKLNKAFEEKNDKEIKRWANWLKFYEDIKIIRQILSTPCQIFQWLYTKCINKRFYYTETKEILTNKWLQLLGK